MKVLIFISENWDMPRKQLLRECDTNNIIKHWSQTKSWLKQTLDQGSLVSLLSFSWGASSLFFSTLFVSQVSLPLFLSSSYSVFLLYLFPFTSLRFFHTFSLVSLLSTQYLSLSSLSLMSLPPSPSPLSLHLPPSPSLSCHFLSFSCLFPEFPPLISALSISSLWLFPTLIPSIFLSRLPILSPVSTLSFSPLSHVSDLS